MSKKAENRFIARVHKKLPDAVYAEKMSNPWRGGTPDCVYEGTNGYHWIEYKYLETRPVRSFKPDLTKLQFDWLKRAYEKKRRPWVVVGWPKGCVILSKLEQWDSSVRMDEVSEMNIDHLADLIDLRVNF